MFDSLLGQAGRSCLLKVFARGSYLDGFCDLVVDGNNIIFGMAVACAQVHDGEIFRKGTRVIFLELPDILEPE